jgi:hypothetical protein
MYCGLLAAIFLSLRISEGAAYGTVFLLGMVKYFPFAAILAFLRPRRRTWVYAAAFFTAVATFVFVSRKDFGMAASLNPARFSWGYRVLFQLGPIILREHGYAVKDWSQAEMLLPASGACAFALLAGWRNRRRLQNFLDTETLYSRTCFIAGCAIYTGCFLISTNYEYRNVFLILLLPHLMLVMRRQEYERRLACCGLFVILAVFLLSWYRDSDVPFVAYQLFYWALFLFSAPMCLASLLSALPVRSEAPS